MYTKVASYADAAVKTKNNSALKTVRAFILSTAMAFMAASCTSPFSADISAIETPAPTTIDQVGFDTLFDITKVHDLRMEMDTATWESWVLEVQRNKASNLKFPATFKTTIGGKAYELNVGIRERGNSTRTDLLLDVNGNGNLLDDAGKFKKAHFLIDFNEFVPNQKLFGLLKGMSLKWAQQNDPTLMRELIAYQWLRDAGLKAPQVTSIHLVISVGGVDHDYGMYYAIEAIDKPFLTREFGSASNDGDLWKTLYTATGPAYFDSESTDNPLAIGLEDSGYKPTYNLTTNTDNLSRARERLKSFIENINRLNGSTFNTYIDGVLNVDGFLRLLAMNQWLGSPDDILVNGNNAYLYINNNGKWEFFPWDYDSCLGGGWAGFDTAHNDVYSGYAFPDQNGKLRSRPLIEKILANPVWKTQYSAYLKKFGEEIVTYSNYQSIFNQLQPLYTPYLNDSTVNSPGSMSMPVQLQYYLYERAASINSQIAGNYETGPTPQPVGALRLRTNNNSWGTDVALTQDVGDPNLYTGIIYKACDQLKIDDENSYGDWTLGDNDNNGLAEMYGSSIKIPQTNAFPLQLTFNLATKAYSFSPLYQSVFKYMGVRTDKDWNKTIPLYLVGDNRWKITLSASDFGSGQVFKFVNYATPLGTDAYGFDVPANYFGDTNADGWADNEAGAWNLVGTGIYYFNDQTWEIEKY